METVEQNYGKGEIVWAKLSGYPWWPGAIADIDIRAQDPSTSVCLVKFFGQNSQYLSVLQFPSSVLGLSKIAKYTQFFSEFSRKALTSKKLRDSIEIAENILKGKKDLKRELAHVQTSLEEMKHPSRQFKTSVAIDDHTFLCSESVESNSISCSPALPPISKTVSQSKAQSVIRKPQLDQDDQLVLQELEIQGTNQENIISILEYGLIKRLSLVDKEKSRKLKRIAKEVLLRKYFSKPFLREESREHKQIQWKKQRSVKSLKSVKSGREGRKRIQKEPRKPKTVLLHSDIEILCVKRLYSILKIYKIDSQCCRLISSSIVSKLRARYDIESTEFQKEYLTFIEWVKCHYDDPETIAKYQDHYSDELSSEDQTSKRSQATGILSEG